MSVILTIVIVVITMLVMAALIWFATSSKKVVTRMRAVLQPNHTYFRFTDDLKNTNSLEIIRTLNEVFDAEGGIVKGSKDTADVYFFETLNYIDQLMPVVKFSRNTKYIFGIQGTDEVVSKSAMAINMREKLPSDVVASILPATFVYDVPSDIRLLYSDMRAASHGIYILKKNIQRQEGNLITCDPQTVLDGGKRDYVVAQRLLQNPMVVGGRKINMRVYLLISIEQGKPAEFYIYKDGFVYYTPKLWDPLSIDPETHITTGYIDRQIYEENPLTFKDLEFRVGTEGYSKLWSNIVDLMGNVRETYRDELTRANIGYPGTKFLVYGCDVAPDDQMQVKLIEINKGPDLGYKDDRDKQVKYNMVRDACSLIGLISTDEPNGFVHVQKKVI